MIAIRALLVAATALTAVPAVAQTNPLAARENRVPPIVSYLQSQGIKLTYLGEEGGLRGYIAESANGKMQAMYVTPDGNHVLAGILFGERGKNITGIQIGEMRARFDSAAGTLGTEQIDEIPEFESPAVTGEENSSADQPEEEAPEENSSFPDGADADDAAEVIPEDDSPAAEQAALSLPEAVGPIAGAAGNPSELWVSKIDKDEFTEAASQTPFFRVGSAAAPTTLWMVADPQCPFCHQAWDHVEKSVLERKLNVHVILIAGLEGSEPIARDMLAQNRPGNAFLDSRGGRNHSLSADTDSEAYAKTDEFLEMNMAFARRFGVDRTPFLGYSDSDGQFYSALGLPGDMNAFLAAAKIN